MITKITPYKPINSVNSNKNKSELKCFTPSFQASPDKFINSARKPINTAVESILETISKGNFKKITERLMNPDEAQIKLESLALCAQRTGLSKDVNLRFAYSGSNVNGSIPIVSGSEEEVKAFIQNENFLPNLIKKIKIVSDEVYFMDIR